jgi:hypothetical protein
MADMLILGFLAVCLWVWCSYVSYRLFLLDTSVSFGWVDTGDRGSTALICLMGPFALWVAVNDLIKLSYQVAVGETWAQRNPEYVAKHHPVRPITEKEVHP